MQFTGRRILQLRIRRIMEESATGNGNEERKEVENEQKEEESMPLLSSANSVNVYK